MRLIGLIAAVIAALGLGLVLWVRLAPSDAGVWHVDPASNPPRGPRNSYLMAPGGDAAPLRLALPPAEAAARLDAVALASPRTTRLAGQGEFVTYLTRSALFGFPDYTSVRVRPVDGGSEILIFARSRFGDSDLGVNRARLEDWIARLSP